MVRGRVVKLDRGFPQVLAESGDVLRCEHATALVKGKDKRMVIGDFVEVDMPDGHDKGVIVSIYPRTREFVRKDPTERTQPQVLAANFDKVIIAEPLADLNFKRLERELVLAHETGADVCVVLTKADLADSAEQVEAVRERAQRFAGAAVDVLVISAEDPDSVEAVRRAVPAGTLAILIGKSGVGKSSLINVLVGREVRVTGDVRAYDGKGRHTTVSRAIVDIPGAGSLVDMPGVRGLGLWDADAGIEAAFAEVEELAAQCRFRDCKHEAEPGCAVRAAVEAGELSAERFASYQALKQEVAQVAERREQARQMRGQKASGARGGRTTRGKRK